MDKVPLMSQASQLAQNLPQAAQSQAKEAMDKLPSGAQSLAKEAMDKLPSGAQSQAKEAMDKLPSGSQSLAKEAMDKLPTGSQSLAKEAMDKLPTGAQSLANKPLAKEAMDKLPTGAQSLANQPLAKEAMDKLPLANQPNHPLANQPRDIADIPKLKEQLPSVPPTQSLPLGAPRVFPPTLQQQYPPMPPALQGPPLPRPGRQTRICAEPPEVRRARIKRVTVSAVKEIAKTLILILSVTLYAILGALAFRALEQTNERDTCVASENLYIKMENDTASSFWKAANKFRTADNPDAQQQAIEQMIQNFTDNVRNIGYNGLACSKLGQPGGPQYNWNFPGSLLFSVTIFTTVGYGNITPKTDWGRMFCIAYAMIGLPLMFFTLANIGEHMATVFRFVYVKICCLGLCAKKRQPPPAKPQPWGNTTHNPIVEDDDDDDENEDEEEITIPLTLTLLVIAGYIGLGALIFAVWENWDAMAAAYFTFITVSTIGLGDLVPGFNNTGSDAEGSLKLLTCAAFMLFGMALLSMGFDLIQYEMANKITAIGGQNVGRAGDTVNELEGKDDKDMDVDVAPPARNVQLPTRANQQRPSIGDMKDPNVRLPVGPKVVASHT